MPTERNLWKRIDQATDGAANYKDALRMLSVLPPGYSLCFAFHYVDADLCNGGIGQLYANSTWSLIVKAIDACCLAEQCELERLLKEIVLYYHQRGKSRLKKKLNESFFVELNRPLERTLDELETEYFKLETQAESVVAVLIADPSLWNDA